MKRESKEFLWSLLGIACSIMVIQRPVILVLHEFGHWIANLFLCWDWGTIHLFFDESWGYVSTVRGLPVLDDMVSVMGAGFQHLLGCLMFTQFRRGGWRKIFRYSGMVMYLYGWRDIHFGMHSILHSPNDFGENTLLRLFLLLILNLILIGKMVKNITGRSIGHFLAEWNYQMGLKQRKVKPYIDLKQKTKPGSSTGRKGNPSYGPYGKPARRGNTPTPPHGEVHWDWRWLNPKILWEASGYGKK